MKSRGVVIKKWELPAWEFLKSCADLIAESFVPIVGVFEQNQTTVAGKAAFSGEVERVTEIVEQVHGLVYPLEAVTHCFAERAALVFVTYDLPDSFPGAGCVDLCLCSGFMIQILHRLSGDKYVLNQMDRELCGLLDTVNGSVRKGVQPGKPDAEMITPAAAQCSHLNEAADILIEEGFIRLHRQLQRVRRDQKTAMVAVISRISSEGEEIAVE